MSNLPKVKKGIGSGLTRSERVRKTVLGLALAVGLGTGSIVSLPSVTDAKTPSLTSPSRDQGAVVLTQDSAQVIGQQVAQHYSHYSHSSHYSHVSHYSHYSSRD
jgi:hypothetical protein